jgi:hypothetical protein
VEASDELRARLLSLYAAMSSGDADAVEAHYSLREGSVFVGSDTTEFWTDSAQHNADVRPYFDGSNGVLTWQAGGPLAQREGKLGWTIDRPTVRFPDGTSVSLRLTLVWLWEDGLWKVVHSHASAGQGGE